MTRTTRDLIAALLLLAAATAMSGCSAGDLIDELGNEDEPELFDEEIGSTTSEIINGYNTTIASNPWQVSLQRYGSHYCGGSILSANWVITAAHCAQSPESAYQIAAGVTDQDDVGTVGQLVNVSNIIVHPSYVSVTQGNDVALMQLATPLDLTPAGVSTIQIATQDDADAGLTVAGIYSTATGWGQTESTTSPDILQKGDHPIIDNHIANQIFMDNKGWPVGADMIATGFPGVDREGPCHGDSGGPLTVPNGKGDGRLLAGLVSWGEPGCGSDEYPVIYTRVSMFDDWVRQQMGCFTDVPGGLNFCSAGCPCGPGKGDCDSDADCMEGTSCAHDVGANYGWNTFIDVCEPTNVSTEPNGGWSHCTTGSPCDIGEGDCDSDLECLPGLECKTDIGPNYGWASAVDVCERPCVSGTPGGWSFASTTCPGGEGDGDCDSDAQCAPDLFCNHDVGADYGYPATMDVCESRNLLSNASAYEGITGWTTYGDSGSATTASGKSVFFLEETSTTSAYLLQDVVLPKYAAGKYVLFIGYGWAEHTVFGSITRHPYLYGYEMNSSGTIINYLQGQNMRHTANARWWQTMDGIFQLDANAHKIRFFLQQASQASDPADGTRAQIDDVGLLIFDTLAEAEEYRDYYRTTHPLAFE